MDELNSKWFSESTEMPTNFSTNQSNICNDIDSMCIASEMYFSHMAKGLFFLLLGGLIFLILIDVLLVVLLVEMMLSEQLHGEIESSGLFRNIIVKYFIPGFNDEDGPREETSFDASITKKNKKGKGKNTRKLSKDTKDTKDKKGKKDKRPSKSVIVIEPGQRDLKQEDIGDRELQTNTARSDRDSCKADVTNSLYKPPSQKTVNSLKHRQAKITPNVSKMIGPNTEGTIDKTQVFPLIDSPAKSLMAKTPGTDADMDKTQKTLRD